MVFAAATGSGRGRVLAIFGPRTAASAPSLPVPLRSRKRPKARMPASARISERLLMALARRAARKARTSAGVSAARSRKDGAPPRESADNREMVKRVVDVLVPVALDRPYSYRAPAELDLAPGDIVTVPLGPRETTGVVWAENAKPNPRLDNRLKDVEEKLQFPPLKP